MSLKSTSIAEGAIISLTFIIPSAKISGGVFSSSAESPDLFTAFFVFFLNKSKIFNAISYSSIIAGFTIAVL